MKLPELKKRFQNKYVVRIVAGVLTIAMVGTGFSVYTVHAEKAGTESTAQTAESTADSDDGLSLSSMLKDNISVNEKEIDKDETVYLISDASGNVNKTIVSDHLINHEKAATLKDKSSLKDIENVKGDETFSQSGNDLTWQADGSDIYYQGTSNEKAPVTQKVTYSLDGKEISPEDLAGKSGKVTIRFDYTNNSTYTEKVNGEDVTVCVPFAAITGMVFDDSFSNIEVTNGKVSNTGKGNIVIGYALPGLKDSLNLNDEDMDEDVNIPEYFEVTADVENFSLETAMTVVANAGSLVSTDGSSDLSSVDDMIDTLTDASEQLQDGSKQLADGLDTLQSSLKEFSSGMDTLSGGIKSYTDGAKTLGNGITMLKNGMDTLAGSSPALVNGVNQLKAGSTKASDGAGQLVAGYEGSASQTGLIDGAKALADGAAQVASGAAALQDGASQLQTGSESAAAGASQLVDGIAELQTGTDKVKDGSAQVAGGASDLADGTKQVADGASQVAENAQLLSNTVDDKIPELKALINNMISSQMDSTTIALLKATGSLDEDTVTTENIATVYDHVSGDKKEIIIGAITQALVSGGLDSETASQTALEQYNQLSSALATANSAVSTLTQLSQGMGALAAGASKVSDGAAAANTGAQSLKDGASQVDAGVGQLQDGEAKLKTGADTLSTGLTQLNAGVKSLYEGAFTLHAGASKVSDGANTVSGGVQKVYDGTKSLASGISQLDAGLGTVTAKMPDLTSGISQLVDGAGQLKTGADTLVSNNDALTSGASKLVDGTSQIVDGVKKLDDGSHTLADGMVEFNEEGINKIVNAYKGDLKPLANRLQAVIDAGENYQSYTDLADGANGSVKFIYKLDSIKAEK